VAQAEPLAEIRGTVTKDRIQAGCPELKYNQLLQEIAFAKVFYAWIRTLATAIRWPRR